MERDPKMIHPWAKRIAPDEFQVGFTVYQNGKHEITLPTMSLGNIRKFIQDCEQAVTRSFREVKS